MKRGRWVSSMAGVGLLTLCGRISIVAAGIYTAAGELFARYERGRSLSVNGEHNAA